MKAMQYRNYGTPDQLQPAEVPTPRPGPTQLLVRVLAASVNPVDWKLHNGQYRRIMPVRFPSIPGFDLAGEVTEVGGQVTRFKPGDRIFAMLDRRPGGTSAEYAAVGERAAARMPANLAPHEAAAVPLAGLTALQCLRDLGRIASGKRVLIIGASGGVGHLAVQIAKSYGANVTAVCSGRNAELMLRLGADRTIDYTQTPDLRGPQPYDLVLDLIVHSPLRRLLALLAADGIYVSSLPSASRIAAAFLLPFVSRRRVRIAGVKPRGADLDDLSRLCEAGKLRPVIDRTFELKALAAAHAYSQQGRTVGKVVIQVAS
jgi:NADPH:quinone reductase-like Zn-dependent oxidoreductase